MENYARHPRSRNFQHRKGTENLRMFLDGAGLDGILRGQFNISPETGDDIGE